MGDPEADVSFTCFDNNAAGIVIQFLGVPDNFAPHASALVCHIYMYAMPHHNSTRQPNYLHVADLNSFTCLQGKPAGVKSGHKDIAHGHDTSSQMTPGGRLQPAAPTQVRALAHV